MTATRTGGSVAALRRVADEAAVAASVEVREIDTPDECARACELVCEVWLTAAAEAPVQASMLRALAHSGGYVVGAYDWAGTLVGVCVGFFGHDVTAGMHSHLAAVSPRAQTRGVGRALKLHQRAWAAERGVPTIGWTFDPLVRRNAVFNLGRLGATAVSYLPDFYGAMSDGVNAGQGSDRLLLHWDVSLPAPVPSDAGAAPAGGGAAAEPVEGSVPSVLAVGDAGEPVPREAGAGAVAVTVGLPRDIEALRRRDPGLGRAWRQAVRAAVHPRLELGWRITGVTAAGAYVLQAG